MIETPFVTAANILVERRMRGVQGERLPEFCRPQDLNAALAIQAAVTERWCDLMDDSIGGWKCLLPPPGKLIVGPIYTRTIDSIPPVSLWPKGDRAHIEPELAFFFHQDLPARAEPYTEAEIDAAIGSTHLALELINSRYVNPADCEFPEVLADGLVNQGLFIGPRVDSEAARQASRFAITVRCANGETMEYLGQHPNHYPRVPVYWLIEFLRSQGQGIIAGQVVITGSYAGVIEVPLNTEICINYAGLGEMQVNFRARPAS